MTTVYVLQNMLVGVDYYYTVSGVGKFGVAFGKKQSRTKRG